MPRKRKIAVKISKQKLIEDGKEMKKILYNVQLNEAYHKKYTKELQQLYEKMEHDDFTSIFIICIKQLMQGDANQYNNLGLKFMAKFVTSFQGIVKDSNFVHIIQLLSTKLNLPAEDMHPLFDSIFQWIFKCISLTASIRLRLCEFINLMMNSLPDDGDIEEFHCNEILSYMFDRLKDISPHVRVQAIKALYRLQIIDDPDDEVTKIFLFHLNHDPSPLVRQAVLSSIARSIFTIPSIIERLLDVDERVRVSVLANMSNFSLNKYTIEQRLTLLEQGLNDSSERVRGVTINVLLPQWLACCDNNFITFLSSLKLNGDEIEMSRFQTIARTSLLIIFKSHDPCKLVNVLPLIDGDESSNYHRCIQIDKLTPELSVFWFTLIEFFQSDKSICEIYLEEILPDLTTYCDYIVKFSSLMDNRTNDNTLLSESNLLTLIEMLHKFDLDDESGRRNVQNVIVHLLTKHFCDKNRIVSLIKISEKLIPTSSDRLRLYVDIVEKIINPIDEDTELITSSKMDLNTEIEVASLKLKLFELKEEERECRQVKDYDKISTIKDEILLCNKQLAFLVNPLLPCESITAAIKRTRTEIELKALQLIFYGVCSETVKELTPSMFQLYNDVIRVGVESKNMEIRNWALKCTATFSLLYDQIANESYSIFCKQLFCVQHRSIWITSIGAIFQLLNRYGFERFLNDHQNTDFVSDLVQSDNSLNGTLMSCKSLNDFHYMHRADEEYVSAADILLLFARYLDSSKDADLTCELVDGFGMLILHGRFFDEKIMSSMLIMFYNSNTEPKIVQILSIFFETLIQQKKQKYLQLALSTTLTTITTDETLIEVQPRLVLQFCIQSTLNRSDPYSAERANIHNDIAIVLLTWMDHHLSDRKSLNLISKEMLTLKVSEDREIRLNLIDLINPLLEGELHKETKNNLRKLKEMMEITTSPLEFSSTKAANEADEDGSHFSNENSDDEIEPEICENNNVNKRNVEKENSKVVVSKNQEQEVMMKDRSEMISLPEAVERRVSNRGKRMSLLPLDLLHNNKKTCDIANFTLVEASPLKLPSPQVQKDT